jgi:hypothetical protein
MDTLEMNAPEYESPRVVDYGDLTELTAGDSDGDNTDAAFPVNTPKRLLTFS